MSGKCGDAETGGVVGKKKINKLSPFVFSAFAVSFSENVFRKPILTASCNLVQLFISRDNSFCFIWLWDL